MVNNMLQEGNKGKPSKRVTAAEKRLVVKERVRKSASQQKSIAGDGSFKKKYTESHDYCMVTFRLPKAAVSSAKKVTIVGDFNNWDEEASPMKKLKNGDFQITLVLPSESEYKFRYLIDGSHWENDWCADKYMPNPYWGDDSVVIV
jgi:1,4-alpha-glucan branching enzyme